MYFLKTQDSFDAAHFLKDYQGKCKNIHGHRWKVIVEIKREDLEKSGPKRGMVVDFADLKQELKDICDKLDHSLIYEKGSLKDATLEALKAEDFRMVELDFVPTAENFSEYFYRLMQGKGFDVKRVEVYETPNNCAAYEE